LPIGRFDEAARKARKLKSLLSGEENASAYLKLRSKRREFRQLRDEIAREKQEYNQAQDEIEDIKDRLASIKQETEQIKNELRTAEDPAEISEYEQRKERLQQERSRLREELRATKKKARTENVGRKKSKKRAQQEIFQLERELDAAKKRQARTSSVGWPSSPSGWRPTSITSSTRGCPSGSSPASTRCRTGARATTTGTDWTSRSVGA
jgi:chromosome segregation ATPase